MYTSERLSGNPLNLVLHPSAVQLGAIGAAALAVSNVKVAM